MTNLEFDILQLYFIEKFIEILIEKLVSLKNAENAQISVNFCYSGKMIQERFDYYIIHKMQATFICSESCVLLHKCTA